jgi:hypothetical protein
MDEHHNKQAPRGYKREDGAPKNGPGDDIPGRIAGLEKAKMEAGMTPADIAALDRSIKNLKEKLAYIEEQRTVNKS